MAIQLQTTFDGLLLPVKVVPGASRTRVLAEWDGRLKIAVAAPPERGKANDALIAYLAKRLGLRRQQVTVTKGASSPIKTISIDGVDADQVRRVLIDADQVPWISEALQPSLKAFSIHFGSTWVIVWLFLNGPMRVVLLRWRFRGGAIL